LATPAEKYLKPEVIRQVARLDLRAKFIVEGFISGLHASPFQGFSVEFSEHRKYSSGDNISEIDWSVPALPDFQSLREADLMDFLRITHDPAVMGGKPCIRGLRVTVGTVLGLLASGEPRDRILGAYPYLETQDIDEALAYAAWRLQERDEELSVA